MSFLRYSDGFKVKASTALIVVICFIVAGCASSHTKPAPNSSLVLASTNKIIPIKPQVVLSKGSIFMKRKTVYTAPVKEELEDKIRRVVQTSITANQEPIEDAIRNIVKQEVEISDSKMRSIAENTFLSSSNQMQAFAKEAILDSGEYIKLVTKETLAEFTAPTDEFAIKAIVKEAIDKEMRIASLNGAMVNSAGEIPEGDIIDIIPSKATFTDPSEWIQLKDYNVVVHEDNTKLRDIMKNVMTKAEPFVGPWSVKWKLKRENSDVINERFSLDAETTFASFADYISDFLRKYRGFPIAFKIFEEQRILVITD